MVKSLEQMMEEVRELNTKNGWFMEEDFRKLKNSVPQHLLDMQLVLTEMLEAYRNNDIKQFSIWLNTFMSVQTRFIYNLQQAYVKEREKKTVAEGLFLITSEISEAYQAILNYDLENLGEEFADIFIRLLDCSEHCGIDLESEYEKKMKKNWTRSYRHGNKKV